MSRCLGFLTLFAGLSIFISAVSQAQPTDLGPRAGQKAPLFKGTDLEGNSVSLEGLRGKPVVLIFWATWCPPCRQRIPGEIALRKKFTPDELAMVSVSDEDKSTVSEFAAQNNINFTVVLDENSRISRLYGVQYLPTVYLIDKEGIILDKPDSPDRMERLVDAMIKGGGEEARALVARMSEEQKLLNEAGEKYKWGDQAGFKEKLLEFKKRFPDSTMIEKVDAALKGLGETAESTSPSTGESPPAADVIEIGEKIGAMEVALHKGEPLILKDPPGRPVVFYFWSTENDNSVKDVSDLIARAEAIGKTDLALVLVNLDSDASKADAFLAAKPVPFNLVRDSKRFDSPLALNFRVEQIPGSVMVSPDGTLVARNLYGERFVKGLELLLGEKSDELLSLYHQDELERGMILQARTAWDAGDKERYYEILTAFIQRNPESPYAPKVKTILEQAGKEAGRIILRNRVGTGDIAPDFRAPDLDGKEVSLAQFTGRPLLLSFWTATSLPCVAEAPLFNALRQKYTEETLGLVAVSLDAEKEKAAAKSKECGMRYTVLHDGEGMDSPNAKAWGVTAMPATYLVDRSGKIAAIGFTGKVLERAVELIVSASAAELKQFTEMAAEAKAYLDESEQIHRESGPIPYYERMSGFIAKYPDYPDNAAIQAWLDEHAPKEADLTEYQALVGKAEGIRRIKKDFRILTWAMAEYAANHGGFPADLNVLVGDDDELKQRIADPFGGGAYRYHSDGKTYWIILSNGPDGDKDVDEAAYAGDQAAVAPKSFDAAQGTESDGDLFITNGE